MLNVIWKRNLQSSSKVLGRLLLFTSFFSLPPPTRPIIEQNFNVCVRNCSVIYPNIDWGDGEYLTKVKTLFFWGLKWTTVKLYNLPNYFWLGLSENSGRGREWPKVDEFLSVGTTSENTRKRYCLEKKYLSHLAKSFWRTSLFIFGTFCNPVSKTIALCRKQKRAKIQM